MTIAPLSSRFPESNLELIGNRFLALRSVGPESEAESVRFHGRRVTKAARKSNTAAAGGLGAGALGLCLTFQLAKNATTGSVS